MVDEPVTIKAQPRKAVNLTASELLNAVLAYLEQQGLAVARLEYGIGDNETEITLHGITENGQPWTDGRYIFFDLVGVRFRSVNARIGGGPFVLTMRRTRTAEESNRDVPCTILFDVVAIANADRSITFRKVQKRDNGKVYY